MADLSTDAERLRASGLFDAEWYRAAHPDVALLGMDPAEHYLKYGGLFRRDPNAGFDLQLQVDLHPGLARKGAHPLLAYLDARAAGTLAPSPKTVLWAAARLAARGRTAQAIALAEAHLPAERRHTVEILRANAARDRGDEAAWLLHLNGYLAHFGMAPVRLRAEGSDPGPDLLARLTTDPLPFVETGPLVTVIMPAWNAAATVAVAMRSVLAQTWRPLELIVVDDASTDGTPAAIEAAAALDPRVKTLRNAANVGPYVSKNRALAHAAGAWVTGHDADDWAHPERIARHMAAALRDGAPASLAYMLRLRPNGRVGHFSPTGPFSPDGVTRIASISGLFAAPFLRGTLGHWDTMRFGADSELIGRARAVLGAAFRDYRQLGMICLDAETSLTNDPVHGVRTEGGLSPVRQAYKTAWRAWHRTLTPETAHLAFPQPERRFAAPEAAAVPSPAIEAVLAEDRAEDRAPARRAAAPPDASAFRVERDGGRFDFLHKPHPERRLFVLLAGARDVTRQPLPFFNRWKWRDDFPGHVLCAADPALARAPDRLRIGWYAGTEDRDWRRTLAGIVLEIARRHGIASRDVICYGSSAGGFAALTLAAQLGDATAVAINPQTHVLRYYPGHVRDFREICFPATPDAAFETDLRDRVDAVAALRAAPSCRALIRQNVRDAFHHERHFLPFCAAFGIPATGGAAGAGRIRAELYEDPRGHGPEPRGDAPFLILQALALSRLPGAGPAEGAPAQSFPAGTDGIFPREAALGCARPEGETG